MNRPLSILLLAAIGAVAGPLAVVLKTEGSVHLATAKGDRVPKAGDLVLSDWKISTGRDGRIRLRLLADKTLVDLKPSSSLELGTLERADRTLRRAFLASGEVSYSLSGEAGDFRAETRTSVVSGRLSEFAVSTGIDGTTRIQVSDGTLSICDPSTGDHVVAGPSTTTTSGWDGLTEPVATTPAGGTGTGVDSSFAVEVRLVDPSSGATSRLHYGLGRER